MITVPGIVDGEEVDPSRGQARSTLLHRLAGLIRRDAERLVVRV